MVEIPKIATRIVAEEAIRNQLHNLEDTIASLLEFKDSLTKESERDRLFEEISALDSIADVIRQALDSLI